MKKILLVVSLWLCMAPIAASAAITYPCMSVSREARGTATLFLSSLLDERAPVVRGCIEMEALLRKPFGPVLENCIQSALSQEWKVISESEKQEGAHFELLLTIKHFYLQRDLNPLYPIFFVAGFVPSFLLRDDARFHVAVEAKLREIITRRMVDSRVIALNVQGECPSNAGVLGYDRLQPSLEECQKKLTGELRSFVRRNIESSQNFVVAEQSESTDGVARRSRISVAVMDFEGDAIPGKASKALADRFRTDILAATTYRVLERDRMALILKEQGLAQSGACSDRECLINIGELLSVQRIITGTIARLGSIYLLNVREIDVETGEVISSVSMDCPAKLEKLPAAFRKLAMGLAR